MRLTRVSAVQLARVRSKITHWPPANHVSLISHSATGALAEDSFIEKMYCDHGRLNLGGNDAFCVIENVEMEAERCCYEVHFETRKCAKMRLRPGFRPRPRWESLQRSPRPPSWISGTGKVRMKRSRDGKGRGKKGRVEKGIKEGRDSGI